MVERRAATPIAGAIAGMLFALLFSVSVAIMRGAMSDLTHDSGAWLESGARPLKIALGLIPFAGLFFLWFIAVARERLGRFEDQFFATVFLGSGLLFVGMLFVASAVAGGLIVAAERNADTILSSGAWEFGRETTYELMVVYAMRMAAIWTLAISTILLRARLAPRWLVASGYAIAVVLLLTTGSFAWVELLFPAWVMALSVYVLVTSFRGHAEVVRPA